VAYPRAKANGGAADTLGMSAGIEGSVKVALRSVAAGLLLAAALAGCGSSPAATCPADSSCVRVLFLGNSYTYVNDLPATFARLAASGGRQVETAMVAGGGETLDQHALSSESLARISSGPWTYVVLQEQSEIPAVPASRQYAMYPAARKLAAAIEAAGAIPMFYMTAAHRDGAPAYGITGYDAMQLAIDDGYTTIARELGVPVAPVGYTWFVVRRQNPDIDLWQSDGSHPSVAGTYLAACVFYAAIFRASPEGLGFDDGLPPDQARVLQAAAAANVVGLEAQWGLR
jgi:hypothetical protein